MTSIASDNPNGNSRLETATPQDCSGRYVGRFAPTPSGPLHAGSLVAALGSFLDARAQNGRWLLRIDDLDAPRCPPGTDVGIIDTLLRHGLQFDGEPIWQSRQYDRYQEALADLSHDGHLFWCDCSRSQLKRMAGAGQIREGLAGPVYPGTCRHRLCPPDHPAGVRFRVPSGMLILPDRRLGEIRQDPSEALGDVLLKRSDGPVAYHLANVVDDADMGITHVVRGADLTELTPVHVRLQQALRLDPPSYMHLPVLFGPDGRKLSKSNQAEPLRPEQALENLDQAARTLGLPPVAYGDIETQLASWVDAWRERYITPTSKASS